MAYSYSKKDVIVAIKKLFFDKKIGKILNILNDYKSDSYRVHLAILKLSQGNYEKLIEYTNKAKVDFRDVLWWAEYDHAKDGIQIDQPYEDLIE